MDVTEAPRCTLCCTCPQSVHQIQRKLYCVRVKPDVKTQAKNTSETFPPSLSLSLSFPQVPTVNSFVLEFAETIERDNIQKLDDCVALKQTRRPLSMTESNGMMLVMIMMEMMVLLLNCCWWWGWWCWYSKEFTHKRFTKKLFTILYIKHFYKNFCLRVNAKVFTHMFVHTDVLTHRNFAQRCFYTEKTYENCLHEALTHRCRFYTQVSGAFIHKCVYTQALLRKLDFDT